MSSVIEMRHGSGTLAMQQLIEQIFLPAFDNPYLNQKNDQACFAMKAGRLAMSTDAYVIAPLFFPGGDIGSLAVHGTINDLAMAGATPLYLAASFILEEGFLITDLQRIVASMARAAKKSKVVIVTGDTKVVERGKGDGVFITTTGIGIVPDGISLSSDRAKVGDKIIVSGFVGDHGIAIMSLRHNLHFHTLIQSDSVALDDLVQAMIKAVPDIHCLRDPTRGGVATTLNELAQSSKIGMVIEEAKIPIKIAVASACELLGLDALYVANEGKLIAICAQQDAAYLLTIMQAHLLGRDAQIIGTVVSDQRCLVQLKTRFGGMRIIDSLAGELLPRIC